MIHKWLNSRDDLGYALNEAGLVGRGVEVGVLMGAFSQTILDKWLGEVLISIDAWKPLEGVLGYNNAARAHLGRYGVTLNNLQKYGTRSVVVRAESREGSEMLADGSLDFVYIDAGHEYAQVKRDIKLWMPKVKKGGWLCGHDWFDDKHPTTGVEDAVRELNMDIWLTNEFPRSWMVKI